MLSRRAHAVLLVCLFVGLVSAANNVTQYQQQVNRIFDAALSSNLAYERLAYLCTNFNSRISGSSILESAIDWLVSELRSDGFDSVTTEPVTVPNWVRNAEHLAMTSPREKVMAITGLGTSVGTPRGGLSAPVLVVKDFDELQQRASEAVGKIVVFNAPFTTYDQTSTYRTHGASRAARVGAVAMLTRSVTPYSLYTPHTGVQFYEDGVTKIPAAAITVEDAIFLQSLQDQGHTPVLSLYMGSETKPDARSRNIIAELRGTTYPEEIIVIGGHIDSWDVGEGAQDDGGGILQTWEAMRLLGSLGLRPKRTIRLVLFTCEEFGGIGAQEYYKQHVNEVNQTVFCFESDRGTLTPVKFTFAGTDEAREELQQIVDLMKPFVHMTVVPGSAGEDVDQLTDAGVPGAGMFVAGDGGTDDNKYFWWHHTNADTIEHVENNDLKQCVGAVAALTYVVAEMDNNLPRTK